MDNDELLNRLKDLKASIETSHQQIFSSASSIEEALVSQEFARIFLESKEQIELLDELVKSLKEVKTDSSQFKKKNTERKNDPETLELK